MAAKGQCMICGYDVKAHEMAAYPVTGWELERMQGGANHIAERERVPGRVAHVACYQSEQRQRKLGVSGAQESLL